MQTKFVKSLFVTAILATGFTMATAAFATDITGAGATFPYPIYAKWAESYNVKTGVKLNYQSIGSGGGIKQITNKTVDFGLLTKNTNGASNKKIECESPECTLPTGFIDPAHGSERRHYLPECPAEERSHFARHS